MKNSELGRGQQFALIVQQIPLMLALVLFWCLLWGSFTVLTVVTGVLLAILVTRVFYLPPVELGGRLNILHAFVFVVWLFADIVRASFLVAAQSVFGPREPQNAIIEVDLLSHHDLVITGTAEAISLVPGSLVLEVERDLGRLFLHVLGAKTQAKQDAAYRRALQTERRIIRTIGSRADVALLRKETS